ncbi:MAG TPA: thiamine phosphate synthase [Blastocatellia bacterium]|nr:thiamine phosphate synthase [Blastocatellia bacterium]
MSSHHLSAHHPLIYLITSSASFRRRAELRAAAGNSLESPERASLEAQLAAIGLAAAAGCQFIQIREPDLTARELSAFVRRAIELARPHGARVLVNDRLDVALATGADGVHLRTSSLSAEEARRIARRSRAGEFLIGASTHNLKEAKEAEAGGADFIVFGPVCAPLSKQVSGPLPGLSGLAAVCQAVEIPVIGLGGMQMDNFAEVIRQGAAGIAAISLFTDPDHLQDNIRELLRRGQNGAHDHDQG